MAEEPEISSDPGKLIRTTKQLAATRQIQAAIKHFRNDDYECAITLAAAAEGLLPPTDYPHMFSVLKDSPFFEKGDINLFITWLKHPTEPDEIIIPEFEVAIIIMRATSKLIAIYRDGTEDMREFGRWVFQAGHLPTPRELAKKSD